MPLQDIVGEGYQVVAKLDVKDLEKSKTWYETKLGLGPASDYTPGWWVQLRIIDSTFVGLNQKPDMDPPTGETTLTFVVKDYDAAKTGLEANGITVTPVDAGPNVKLGVFEDPDKNSLGIRENLS